MRTVRQGVPAMRYCNTMMNVVLRNLVAHWGLAALSEGTVGDDLGALARFVEQADSRGHAHIDPASAGRLAVIDKVFVVDDDGVTLRAGMLDSLTWLRESVTEFVALVERRECGPAPFDFEHFHGLPTADSPPLTEAQLRWSLCAAKSLFNSRLFFEVHEVIEPCWLRSTGPDKEFLKGLIQVAVGLHHHRNGNLRGARALLSDGSDYLKPFRPHHHGLELSRFCVALEGCVEQIETSQPDSWRPLTTIPRLESSD
jgi:predicted metal-dependent hydrolase